MILQERKKRSGLFHTFSSDESDWGLRPFETSSSESLMSGEEEYYRTINACKNASLSDVQEQIIRLHLLHDGWNTRDALAPSPNSIKQAIHWLRDMWVDAAFVTKNELGSPTWIAPHVSVSEEGEVVLEWSYLDRSLHVYISESECTFIADRESATFSEMEDGDASSMETRRRLWLWLLNAD